MNANNSSRPLRSAVAGSATLVAQHALCPGHGAVALSTKAALGTGLVLPSTLDRIGHGLEQLAVTGLTTVGVPARTAHAVYHHTTEDVVPLVGYGLLAYSGYQLARRAWQRHNRGAAPPPVDPALAPYELPHPETFR